jgi:hypothetical protein
MALKSNITTLGPLVLPVSEQVLFGVNMLMRKIYGSKKVKQYVPNFSKAFEHICIHTGAHRSWGGLIPLCGFEPRRIRVHSGTETGPTLREMQPLTPHPSPHSHPAYAPALRRPRGHRRDREAAGPRPLRGGALARVALPLRQCQQQQHLVCSARFCASPYPVPALLHARVAARAPPCPNRSPAPTHPPLPPINTPTPPPLLGTSSPTSRPSAA